MNSKSVFVSNNQNYLSAIRLSKHIEHVFHRNKVENHFGFLNVTVYSISIAENLIISLVKNTDALSVWDFNLS